MSLHCLSHLGQKQLAYVFYNYNVSSGTDGNLKSQKKMFTNLGSQPGVQKLLLLLLQ